MPVTEFIETISEKLHDSASVKKIFGDPITSEGKTIIPVARVRYGFGGGGGISGKKLPESGTAEEGGGGGGGIKVTPVGVVEISTQSTRFIPFRNYRSILGYMIGGAALGFLTVRIISKRPRYS